MHARVSDIVLITAWCCAVHATLPEGRTLSANRRPSTIIASTAMASPSSQHSTIVTRCSMSRRRSSAKGMAWRTRCQAARTARTCSGLRSPWWRPSLPSHSMRAARLSTVCHQ